MPNGVLSKDVKFLGVVQSYNEAKNFGMVRSEEAMMLWEQEIYAFRDVLAQADASVGDTIRFGIHVNNRGQPQVSLPVWKVDPMGNLIGADPEVPIINAEEAAAEDPNFLEQLKEEIQGRSEHQNHKRSMSGGGAQWGAEKRQRVDDGKGGAPWHKGKGKGTERQQQGGWKGGAPRPHQSTWGAGTGEEACIAEAEQGYQQPQESAVPQPSAPGEVTLFVSGLPADATAREVAHAFRQYQGYLRLKVVQKQDHAISFVTFETPEQAQFVADALTGYTFDEQGGSYLAVKFAQNKARH